MKFSRFALVLLLLFSMNSAFSQQDYANVQLKKFDNTFVDSHSFSDNGKITIFVFWISWQVHSRKNLQAFQDLYSEWRERYNVEIVAISIDDPRTIPTAKKLTNEKAWEFISVIDTKRQLMKALEVTSVPHAIIFDENGNLVHSVAHTAPAEVPMLENELKKLLEK